jgi:mono/diheme cytochrome c family protein
MHARHAQRPEEARRASAARWRRRAAAFCLAVFGAGTAAALPLPAPESLRATMPTPAAVVRVVEPHLSNRQRQVQVDYRGWPAEAVLDRLFGDAWRAPGTDLEFRALDGYVSRIPAERFARYRGWLVYERVGRDSFSVDNLQQNQRNVALGPWYLVWDNLRDPVLLPEGGTYWPYQVTQLLLSRARVDALLPPGIAPGHDEGAALTQKYCLSCHRVNGYGGDKASADLARTAKMLPRADFLRWVLQPGQVKPGTTMPGLPDAMPESERRSAALRLFDYLVAVPVKP